MVLDARLCFVDETGSKKNTNHKTNQKLFCAFVFFFVPFVILLFGGGAHREVTGFGQNVHGFRHLWIVRHDENSIANHTTVSRSHDIEPQFELDEGAIAIDHCRCHLVRRIRRHKITKRSEHRIRDLELFRLQLVTEIDPARDAVPVHDQPRVGNPGVERVVEHGERVRRDAGADGRGRAD